MPQTTSRPARRSETRRDRASRTSTAADKSTKNRRRVSGLQRVLRSRRGFRVDRRDVELGETQSACHIHGGYHGLVSGARIGANRDGTAVGTGFLEQRGPQRIGAGIDQGALV